MTSAHVLGATQKQQLELGTKKTKRPGRVSMIQEAILTQMVSEGTSVERAAPGVCRSACVLALTYVFQSEEETRSRHSLSIICPQ
jgi:hypothetical protein